MSQFDQVSVVKKANIFHDGKCVSHSVLFPDGTRKTLGVMFPSLLTFNVGAPERIDINAGVCRVRVGDENEWKTYRAGDSFYVPGDTRFEIEILELLDYVCHFAAAAR
jgi:uncharacterized protein YaiE (UPF0345 family)